MPKKSIAKIEINKSKDSQFYVNVKSPNGKVIFTSETYKRIYPARRAAAIVMGTTAWEIYVEGKKQ